MKTATLAALLTLFALMLLACQATEQYRTPPTPEHPQGQLVFIDRGTGKATVLPADADGNANAPLNKAVPPAAVTKGQRVATDAAEMLPEPWRSGALTLLGLGGSALAWWFKRRNATNEALFRELVTKIDKTPSVKEAIIATQNGREHAHSPALAKAVENLTRT